MNHVFGNYVQSYTPAKVDVSTKGRNKSENDIAQRCLSEEKWYKLNSERIHMISVFVTFLFPSLKKRYLLVANIHPKQQVEVPF